MVFVDQDRGLVELEFRSDEIASFIGEHHHAIRARLRGDERGDHKLIPKVTTRRRPSIFSSAHSSLRKASLCSNGERTGTTPILGNADRVSAGLSRFRS